jgi:hypothetical protein
VGDGGPLPRHSAEAPGADGAPVEGGGAAGGGGLPGERAAADGAGGVVHSVGVAR